MVPPLTTLAILTLSYTSAPPLGPTQYFTINVGRLNDSTVHPEILLENMSTLSTLIITPSASVAPTQLPEVSGYDSSSTTVIVSTVTPSTVMNSTSTLLSAVTATPPPHLNNTTLTPRPTLTRPTSPLSSPTPPHDQFAWRTAATYTLFCYDAICLGIFVTLWICRGKGWPRRGQGRQLERGVERVVWVEQRDGTWRRRGGRNSWTERGVEVEMRRLGLM